jgi:hypothetical protein
LLGLHDNIDCGNAILIAWNSTNDESVSIIKNSRFLVQLEFSLNWCFIRLDCWDKMYSYLRLLSNRNLSGKLDEVFQWCKHPIIHAGLDFLQDFLRTITSDASIYHTIDSQATHIITIHLMTPIDQFSSETMSNGLWSSHW